jgi:hypothetical protein
MEHFKIDLENLSRPQQQRCDPSWLAGRIQLLFSAYRKDDYNDPQGFVMQLGAILEAFPVEVVEYITSPMTGIQRRLKFPPSLAEIVEACQAEMAHLEKVRKYSSMPPPLPRLPKPKYSADQSYEAMTKKYGRPIGVFEPGRRIPYEG